MSKAEAFFDYEYGFTTDVATYELAGHYGQTDQALRADIEKIVAAINNAAKVERLREALRNLVKMNEEHNAAVEAAIGRPLNWSDDYLDEARAALEEA